MQNLNERQRGIVAAVAESVPAPVRERYYKRAEDLLRPLIEPRDADVHQLARAAGDYVVSR